MTAAPKLAGQFAAAVPFAAFGTEVRLVEFCGLDLTIGPALGVLFVACWIVACVNTINLVDGLDGLAGSIGLISCVGIAVIADLQGMTGVAAVALIAAGGLTGFLCHNLPPARIFLGDSGSLLIGFLIAALSSAATAKTATGFALTVPLILVSVPAFDTGMAIARRRLNGRRIGEGDRGHIHHLLQQRGLTRTQTLTVIAGLCTAMATLTVLSVWYKADLVCLGLCLGVLGLLIVGRVFGHAETALLLQRAQKLGQLIWARSNMFGLGLGAGDPAGWDAAVTRAARLGATRLESVRWDERTGVVLDRRGWVPEPQPVPAWELRSTVAAAAGERVTVVAFGVRAPGRRLQPLLDRCCRAWAARPQTASAGVLPLAAARPASAPAETTRKAA